MSGSIRPVCLCACVCACACVDVQLTEGGTPSGPQGAVWLHCTALYAKQIFVQRYLLYGYIYSQEKCPRMLCMRVKSDDVFLFYFVFVTFLLLYITH